MTRPEDPSPRPAQRAGDPAQPLPLRVLLVDDSQDARMLVRVFLRDQVTALDEAGDGVEALARFRASAYDVVLMDVHMPRMDGIEAARAMRALERARGAPATVILALTADDGTGERARSLEAGCDDHLVKPVSRKALLAALRAALQARGGAQSP